MPDLSGEPVIVNGVLAVVAAFATPFLIKLGYDANGAAAIFSAIGALATVVLSGWSVARARSKVSPVPTPILPVPLTGPAPVSPPAAP